MTDTVEGSTRQTIESRTATNEPLVERCANGSLAPTGRRLAFEIRADGLNAYGLADAESTAYWCALARVNNDAASLLILVTTEESKAIQIARDAAPPGTFDSSVFLAAYRKTHPLPTSFADLPDGDPSSNYASLASQMPAEPVIAVDTRTVPMPSMPPVEFTPGAKSPGSIRDVATAAPIPVGATVSKTMASGPDTPVIPADASHPQAQGILKAVAALRKELSGAHWALDYLEQLAHKSSPNKPAGS
ncbi:MAG TPA: hypothetical protein VK636_12715 [Gemmatimonadaceae bacterium]|nr:hypothetical protein [Gemmatimonadaceae bacterium]